MGRGIGDHGDPQEGTPCTKALPRNQVESTEEGPGPLGRASGHSPMERKGGLKGSTGDI